jgi:hypothetical protein
MKTFSILVAGCLLLGFGITAFADRGGSEAGGGGDRCEDRFKVVAHDLKDWINAGGPSGLILTGPQGSISVADYSQSMLKHMNQIHITCVSPGDVGYPVVVSGQAKECRSDRDTSGTERMTCDRAKFYTNLHDPENDSTQYKMVHHELATLAGFEVPTAGDSQYWISDQITGFLRAQTVLKLSVRPSSAKEARVGSVVLNGVRTIGQGIGAVSPDGKHYAYTSDKGVTVLDLLTYQPLFSVPAGSHQWLTLFSPDGEVMCVNNGEQANYERSKDAYTCFNAKDGTKLYNLPNVFFVFFRPDSQSIVSITTSGRVMISGAKTGQVLKTSPLPSSLAGQKILAGSHLSHDGTLLEIASLDKHKRPWVNVMDLRNGRLKFSVSGSYASFSRDDLRIAALINDRKRRGYAVYEASSGKESKFISRENSDPKNFLNVNDIDFLPDGKLMEREYPGTPCSRATVFDSNYEYAYDMACVMGDVDHKIDPAGKFYLGDSVNHHDVVVSSLENGEILTTFNFTKEDRWEGEDTVVGEDRALFVVTPETQPMSTDLVLRIVAIPQI